MGVSQNGWFISCKILLKSDDLGVPPFQETSYSFFYGYGSIPINTIFRGMNIHKSQLF